MIELAIQLSPAVVSNEEEQIQTLSFCSYFIP